MEKSDFAPKEKPSPQKQYITQLSDYIKQYKKSGYSEQQAKDFLISKGYKEEDINSAINLK